MKPAIPHNFMSYMAGDRKQLDLVFLDVSRGTSY